MKQLRNIGFVFFGLLGLTEMSSCDKVSHPYIQKCNSDISTCTFAANLTQPRIVLLEDYTGHLCGNCPPATEKGVKLKGQYGDSLVVMTVHAGGFAKTTAPGTTFDYDFTTPAGVNLNTLFGITSNPGGMVNRKGFPSGTHFKTLPTWETEVANIILTPPDANVFIQNTYDVASRKLIVCTQTKWINTLSGNFRLVLYLTEDSIVKPQLDYRLTPDTVKNFVHRHVLRTVINCEEGDPLSVANAGSTSSKSYAFILNNTWDDKHCDVVAVVFNATTYEVVQAADKKVY